MLDSPTSEAIYQGKENLEIMNSFYLFIYTFGENDTSVWYSGLTTRSESQVNNGIESMIEQDY